MQVAVNGRFFHRPITGVERYAGEILRHLTPRMRLISPDHPVNGAAGHAWEQFRLPNLLKGGEILWSPANSGPVRVNKQALTLQDISPIEHPEWFKPAFTLWYRFCLPILVRRVSYLVVPSEYCRQKCLSNFPISPQRICVVPGGVDIERYKPTPPPSGRWPERYVLFLGTLQPRKNLAGLIQAWDMIYRQFPDTWLLVAGAPGSVFKSISVPAGVEHLAMLGYVSDFDLPALYSGAEVFVLPSFDEGFGLTILEAMACGAAVIAASAGALPEVAGEAALYFRPDKPEQLASQLVRVLLDPVLRTHLAEDGRARAKLFPWKSSAEKLWEVLQACQ